ncbi:prephenate dehydrogenase/arogenate dehydrogenase family protein [Lacticaseibacillus pabuli]|uniref:Prephenate dehydrogenase/arogenate dehydrogenase family protein n=1 Tax=Lacticaseibacillus pabuli TaxID=3025672 RepID=A0ABY7WS35_9LACO|nr:prephenate dehydrogenase/arogenate dehydrogenase family protein [Lacticaseibacillus sp. KACC 23028]WDF82995.1 prephenate dehydrogenase/arogenate dehydrogenase family protein [Lacticaseibacillus sp. KACC 23028]
MNNVLISGLGLIGSSLARAIRQRRGDVHVIGFDADRASLDWAAQHLVIDEAAADFAAGATQADFIILAAPVTVIADQLQALSRLQLKPGVIVTDTGSTKRNVLAAAQDLMAGGVTFIGAHPMAGSERSGVKNGRADLFAEAHYFLVNGNGTAEQVLTLRNLLSAAGAYFVELSPEAHDELVGAISHVPHVVAAGLAAAAADSLHGDQTKLGYAAGGFRDTTRIAASDPDLWTAIVMSNRETIAAQLRGFADHIATIQRAIDVGDATAIRTYFATAQAVRKHLDEEED